MDTTDPAGEYLRITERYRQMSNDELLVLIPQSSELTPLAQQALASEVRTRGLKPEDAVKRDEVKAGNVKPSAPPTAKPPVFVLREPAQSRDYYAFDSPDRDSSGNDSYDKESSRDADSDEEDSYEEERKLVELCTVWSVRDALQVQRILDVAGIPFFMGPEKATGVDKVTSNFAKGVSVQIMQIGMPWAGPAMQYYEPADDPATKEIEEVPELPVRCPACHSTEVVLEDVIPDPASAQTSASKFRWTCDSCGEQWEDDGVVKEG